MLDTKAELRQTGAEIRTATRDYESGRTGRIAS